MTAPSPTGTDFSMTGPSSKFRVAIIGGGVAGLALALSLARDPTIEIDVYEAAHQFAEVGAGIGFWRRSAYILKHLGIFDELAAKSPSFSDDDTPRPAFMFRLGDRPEGIEFWQQHIPGGFLQLHRSSFQLAILDRLANESASNCRQYTVKRLISYSQPSGTSEPITLTFADGTLGACDVLIGGDGLRSEVRAIMYKELGEVQHGGQVWSGVVAYRALVDAEKLRLRWPEHLSLKGSTESLGKNGLLVTYLINNGAHVNIVAFACDYSRAYTPLDGPRVREASADEIGEHFKGWDNDVRTVIECVDTAKRWAIEVVAPLPTFVSGRVALMGDAAHAMTPFQASGGGQAIEDAHLIGALLTHPRCTLDSLPRALAIFDAVRRPLAQEAWRKAQRMGELKTLSDPASSDISDIHAQQGDALRTRLDVLGRDCLEELQWCWTPDFEDQVQRAIAMLLESDE